MGRHAILSNGALTVGLNKRGHVHDFYYPYVGQENLTNSRSMHHRIGVWIDGDFSWLDNKEIWQANVELSDRSLIATTTWYNKKYNVSIISNDFVDYKYDAFCRTAEVQNNSDTNHEIRVFFHQVFEISRAGRGDTAMYVPHGDYILDYKGRVCLLISGINRTTKEIFDQYSVGNYGIEGKAGTYMDAEDGELTCNNIEHAGVDSVIRFSLDIDSKSSQTIDYYIVAGISQINCEKIHNELGNGLDERLIANQVYWEKWLALGAEATKGMNPTHLSNLNKSLMIVRAHIDKRGGIIASCDSSIYNYGRDYYSYVWPRDGAYAIWPLIRLGYTEEPKKFFKFCADIITEDGYMMHKYQPDRAIGSTWHPLIRNGHTELAIQEDETAIIIFMLNEYLEATGDLDFIHDVYDRLIKKPAEFLSYYIDEETGLPHASYDLWEEKFVTSTYTTAVTYRALVCASEIAKKLNDNESADNFAHVASNLLEKSAVFNYPDGGGYRKGFLLQPDDSLQFDDTLDASSFYAVMTYGYYSSRESIKSLVDAVKNLEENLANKEAAGGMPRYTDDYYFRLSPNSPPNPWIITTLWMAQFYIKAGQLDKANEIINWCHNQMLPSGVLSEQINPFDGKPTSVTPLVWSHAEYINTVLDLHQKTGQE
jgi:GH15 family glucan-1,4-alpha-glucosidase